MHRCMGFLLGDGGFRGFSPIHEGRPERGTGMFSRSGKAVVSLLKFGMMVRLSLDGERALGKERLLAGIGRVRDVRQGPDDFIYLLTDAPDGSLLLRHAEAPDAGGGQRWPS